MLSLLLLVSLIVAPFTGAWIETSYVELYGIDGSLSLPSRERGLKQKFMKRLRKSFESLPSRERGLKQIKLPLALDRGTSLPSRERGLKQPMNVSKRWETPSLPSRERGLKPESLNRRVQTTASLPSRERGLKLILLLFSLPAAGRSLHGSVD